MKSQSWYYGFLLVTLLCPHRSQCETFVLTNSGPGTYVGSHPKLPMELLGDFVDRKWEEMDMSHPVTTMDNQEIVFRSQTLNETEDESMLDNMSNSLIPKGIYDGNGHGHWSGNRPIDFPIELESFVGDVLDSTKSRTWTDSRDQAATAFQHWIDEVNRERQNVDRLVRAQKRNHHGNGHVEHPQGHLWTCDTEYGWRNLGKDHYPQFIRTATCTSSNCFSDLYRCIPRQYTVKVLKKLEHNEVVDNSAALKLPEALRHTVKFINVTTNICCECAGVV